MSLETPEEDLELSSEESRGPAGDIAAKSKSAKSLGKARAVEMAPITSDEQDTEERMVNAALQAYMADRPSGCEVTRSLLSRDWPRTCDHCSGLPKFPAASQSRKTFKLIRSPCSDFVAVSYCWPKDKDGNPATTQQTYRFLKTLPDGTTVEMTKVPPDHIVDKAMDFARGVDVRQIWIDIVCLPQDDSEEHQLSVQAIDLIYSRAYMAAGFFESSIADQRMLVALEWVDGYRTSRPAPADPGKALRDLRDVISLLATDRYHSRA